MPSARSGSARCTRSAAKVDSAMSRSWAIVPHVAWVDLGSSRLRPARVEVRWQCAGWTVACGHFRDPLGAGHHKVYELVQASNEPTLLFFHRAGHATEGLLRQAANVSCRPGRL